MTREESGMIKGCIDGRRYALKQVINLLDSMQDVDTDTLNNIKSKVIKLLEV